MKDTGMAGGAENSHAVSLDAFLPGYVDPNFTFLPRGQRVTDEELEEHLGRFFADHDDWKLEALRRGIGMHYSELNRKYKNAVERLFRVKKLGVVIATGTLALGINMPCKTVIIAGDQPYLNALEYHQEIGRAGRRTFDNRGHVVFWVPHAGRCAACSALPFQT